MGVGVFVAGGRVGVIVGVSVGVGVRVGVLVGVGVGVGVAIASMARAAPAWASLLSATGSPRAA